MDKTFPISILTQSDTRNLWYRDKERLRLILKESRWHVVCRAVFPNSKFSGVIKIKGVLED